jgi:hypothetical protein
VLILASKEFPFSRHIVLISVKKIVVVFVQMVLLPFSIFFAIIQHIEKNGQNSWLMEKQA